MNKPINNNISKYNNFTTKNKVSSKVNFLMNSEISVPNNTNINSNDDYFLSLFSNVNKKNKNIQLIAEKVKRMSQKNTSKHSLIYNLNNNYKLNQESTAPPRKNFKEKLKDLMSHRQVDNDPFLGLDEIEQKNCSKDSDFNVPLIDNLYKNNNSSEENSSFHIEKRLINNNRSINDFKDRKEKK
jgi:hypothetical protein